MKTFETISLKDASFKDASFKDASFKDIVDFVNDHTPYCSGDFKISIATGEIPVIQKFL